MQRAEYLAQALSRSQPWRDAGVSRATWYRHRKARAERIRSLVAQFTPDQRRELRGLPDDLDGAGDANRQ